MNARTDNLPPVQGPVPQGLRRWSAFYLLTLGFVVGSAAHTRGGPVPDDAIELHLPAADPGTVALEEAPPTVTDALRQLVLHALPASFENSRQWGSQRQRWDGLRMSLDNGQLHTKRRWKSVNHGTWKKYRAELVDPDQFLALRLEQLRPAGPGAVAVSAVVGARLNLWARLQEWNRGVRLLSISAEGVADVELQIALTLHTSLDPSRFPPDVVFRPRVESAQVTLHQFRLERISHAHGPLVRELGDSLEKLVRERLETENERLAERINRQLDKKQGDIKVSLRDAARYPWLALKKSAQDRPPDAGGQRGGAPPASPGELP